MGADFFETTAAGKDAQAAFHQAQLDARYERGHQGYTGTIAEKTDFTMVTLPKGMTVETLRQAVVLNEQLDDAKRYRDDAEERVNSMKGHRGVAVDRAQAKADLKRWNAEVTRTERAAKKITMEMMKTARRIDELEDSKWGPAVCIEITGKAATEWKARQGFGGTRKRVFRFSGYASS